MMSDFDKDMDIFFGDFQEVFVHLTGNIEVIYKDKYYNQADEYTGLSTYSPVAIVSEAVSEALVRGDVLTRQKTNIDYVIFEKQPQGNGLINLVLESE